MEDCDVIDLIENKYLSNYKEYTLRFAINTSSVDNRGV